ncbi:MAG: glycosyltransferase family 39 protein, partial [Ignavibacteria bacterium]
MNGNNKLLYCTGWFVIAAILFLKTKAALTLDLFEDEALYWMWSLNPDSSYSLITLLSIKLSTFIFSSHSEFVIRFPALLSNLILIFLLVLISKELGFESEKTLLLILSFFSVPLVTIYTNFISPDTFLLLFTVMTYYFWLKLITVNKFRFYLLSGLSMGLAVLSKYQGVLLFLLFLIITLSDRKSFTKNFKGLASTFSVFILTISPVVLWNLFQEPVWLKYYLFTNAETINGGIFKSLTAFLFSQFSILLPFVFVLVIYITILLWIDKPPDKKYYFLRLAYFITICIFFTATISGKIKGNWYFISYIPLLFLLPYFHSNKIFKTLTLLSVIFNLFLLVIINLSSQNISSISNNKIINYLNSGFQDYRPVTEKNSDKNWAERISKMNFWKENIRRIEDEIQKSNTQYDFIVSDDYCLLPLMQYYG